MLKIGAVPFPQTIVQFLSDSTVEQVANSAVSCELYTRHWITLQAVRTVITVNRCICTSSSYLPSHLPRYASFPSRKAPRWSH